MITILKYILLGILQGFTEPIPVSSSGHVFILKNIMDLGSVDLNFEIVVNFGSLLAIMIIYWKDIKELITNFFKFIFTKEVKYEADYKYCWLIVLGVIPVGIVGVLFKDTIESYLNNINIIGISFLITAIFLFFVRNIKGNKEDKDLTWKDALFIGLIQIISVIPGISRSGSTLIAALFRDIKRTPALKYSFMLYIPISIGTMILGIKDILELPNLNDLILPYSLGFLASFIVSYFTLRWFMKLVRKGNLIYFSLYCLVLGILILIFL